MGWDRIGKLYLHTMILIFTKAVQIITAYVFKIYDGWMDGWILYRILSKTEMPFCFLTSTKSSG